MKQVTYCETAGDVLEALAALPKPHSARLRIEPLGVEIDGTDAIMVSPGISCGDVLRLLAERIGATSTLIEWPVGTTNANPALACPGLSDAIGRSVR